MRFDFEPVNLQSVQSLVRLGKSAKGSQNLTGFCKPWNAAAFKTISSAMPARRSVLNNLDLHIQQNVTFLAC
jgi:hypothetical protein